MTVADGENEINAQICHANISTSIVPQTVARSNNKRRCSASCCTDIGNNELLTENASVADRFTTFSISAPVLPSSDKDRSH